MMAMGMKMGAPASKFNPSKNDSIQVMKKYKMDMGGMHPSAGRAGMDGMSMNDDKMKMDGMDLPAGQTGMKNDSTQMDHDKMDHHKKKMSKSQILKSNKLIIQAQFRKSKNWNRHPH